MIVSSAVHAPGSAPLYGVFEKIIDKKVQHVALNIFERVIDFLCAHFYSSYNQRLDFRIKEIDVKQVPQDEDVPDADDQKTAEKIHLFMDGAPLYDRTAAGRAEIKRAQLFDLIKGEKVEGEDQIFVDGKAVYFSAIPTQILLFGKNYGTKEVFVTDVKECPELVMIYERETNDQLKAWCVDTTQPTKKITTGGQLNLFQKEIFIAQQIAPQPVPQPLVLPII